MTYTNCLMTPTMEGGGGPCDHGHVVMQDRLTWLREGLAEGVAQHIFVTPWHRVPTYRPEVSVRPWVFGLARHKCLHAR